MTRAQLIIDVSHTSHTRARTGIQRVVRGLVAALGDDAAAVTFDPFWAAWRTLEPWEDANLAGTTPKGGRGAHWPMAARLRGRARRLLHRMAPLPVGTNAGVVFPEIFSPAVAANLAALPGPRCAIFHDAIPLKLPEFTPAKTVARFPGYLQELLSFDGIAAVSDDSRDALLDYWCWLGVAKTPPVQTIPLGIDVPDADNTAPSAQPLPSSPPTILCVGSIEGRKNHLTLFEACEQLWARGRTFELHVVGIARPETAAPALTRLRELQAQGRRVRHDGAADDAALHAAYAACAFTVYPSLMEGFGLPVLESLAHGKPCICSGKGALGESARGGGCVALPAIDAATIADAIERLLIAPGELQRLSTEARRRTFRTWSDYARDLAAFVTELK